VRKSESTLANQNPNFVLISTVNGHRTLSWPEKGHINRELLRRYLIGLKGPVYYIAGPSGMVTAMTDLLRSSGVSDDDMKTEEFGDYEGYQDSARGEQKNAQQSMGFSTLTVGTTETL
jgi:ferredoxin-NADP reductase